jgi:hypothetical protein
MKGRRFGRAVVPDGNPRRTGYRASSASKHRGLRDRSDDGDLHLAVHAGQGAREHGEDDADQGHAVTFRGVPSLAVP